MNGHFAFFVLHTVLASVCGVYIGDFYATVTHRVNLEDRKFEDRAIGEIKVGILVPVFFAISALSHLIQLFVRRRRGTPHTIRWIEYAASASVMIVAISLLSGATDVGVLVSHCFSTVAMMFTGFMFEIEVQKYSKRRAFLLGCILGIQAWVVIGITFFSATSIMPGFVIAIYFSLLLLFCVFPLVLYLRLSDFYFSLASFAAKAALGLQILFGSR